MVRRRSTWLAAGAVVALGAPGCAGSADVGSGSGSVRSVVATTERPAPTTSPLPTSDPPAPGPDREDEPTPSGTGATVAPSTTAGSVTPRYTVVSSWRDFTDPARQRTMRTRIHRPATSGSFPLVLMAHGYNLPAGGYDRLLEQVAAAGYIVASPAFPHTSQETGDGNRADIVNQPADLSFVATAMIELSRTADSPIPAVASPEHIAVLGHSDGGLTASAIAYNDRYRDPRVAAVVVMTGGIALFPGSYFTARPIAPLLAIHATADATNSYGASVSLFNRVPHGTPRYLVTVEGGSHLGPYMFDTAMPELGRVIIDFLDAYLLAADGADDRLQRDADQPGTLRLQSG